MQAALTGHLVLSTLHTIDAGGSVARLLHMGVEDFLLGSSLIGVVAQRLVRVLCTHCRQPLPAPADLRTRLRLHAELPPQVTLFAPRGMHTMSEDGVLKACAGLTSVEEVLRVTRKAVDTAL